jgi:hopanoid biosynthesis associated RND transporter like protein HpnN
MSDPETTPYSLDVMTGSREEAAALAAKIEELPEVLRAVTINTYIPQQQKEKLEALGDAATLLGPTLTPPQTAPQPSDDDVLSAISACIAKLRAVALGRPADDAAVRLAHDLEEIVKAGPAKLPALRDSVIAGLAPRLAELRLALSARPVTYDDLPPDLVRAWVTPDGRARIEVFPKVDVRTNAGIEKFANAVRSVAPQVSGGPIAIKASADTVVGAFVQAGTLALVAIALLLWITLKSLRDVAMVLIPLLLAAALTLITSVAVGLPLNFANIIALPLLLGIGVAFDIYFVMNWRAGLAGPLQSSTARAVIFSAATTTCAFGSLAASSHPGTADMGKLLALCLFYTLVCTLFILPALLGPVKPPQER